MTIETAFCRKNNPIGKEARDPVPWYAVRVMSNRERVVAYLLQGRGIAASLPVCWSSRNGSVRCKETVLFPGYVFCSFDARMILPVISVPGVVHIVCRNRVPAPVDPLEMQAVHLLAGAGLESEPCGWISTGDRVRVREGPMAGVEGILAREAGRNRIVISVSLLMRSVIVDLDQTLVEGAGPGMVH